MFTVCVGLVFRRKHVQFPIICFLQYSININTVEVDRHSDLLHIFVVKPKNSLVKMMLPLRHDLSMHFLSVSFQSWNNHLRVAWHCNNHQYVASVGNG